MKKFLLYLMICVAAASLRAESPAALSGAWRGELRMGPIAVPLVFNFDAEPGSGAPSFTLDSPQQNVKGLPLTVNFLSADSISVSSAAIGAVFSGRISAGTIDGLFAQRGYTFPMTLTQDEPLELRRPQTPKPPFPYQAVDTTFTSFDGIALAGTLTIPHSATIATPIVVMISGSGPQNRDEEMFEHQPFAVIADFLARNGIASFRYDDRGVGSSQGNFASSTIKTFEADCESALKFVRGMNRFGKAGILGHSEGGTIAMLMAARQLPDFIVSLAGMAIKGKETILDQNRHLMTGLGLNESDIDAGITVIDTVFDEIIANNAGATIDVDKIAQSKGVTLQPVVMLSLKRNVAAATPYLAEMLAVDAGAGLKNVNCAVLAINGTLDTQVDVDKNLGVIRANCPTAEVHRLDGLNHLLQHASTGEVAEYARIRETIAPEVMNLIARFILSQPS